MIGVIIFVAGLLMRCTGISLFICSRKQKSANLHPIFVERFETFEAQSLSCTELLWKRMMS